MMLYRTRWFRTSTDVGYMDVEADSEEDARKKARQFHRNADTDDCITWEPTKGEVVDGPELESHVYPSPEGAVAYKED